MLSLSDNEFSVINFLVRNFSEKLTIRNIAKRLSFSPAGVFNILKKLEKEGIVCGEKLGTGLFYSINLDSRIAEHLAAIVLLYSAEKISLNIKQLKQAKAAIFDRNSLLVVTDSMTQVEITIPNVNVVTKTEDEAVDLLKRNDAELLQILKQGIVLFGEEKIVGIIKKAVSRF